MKTIKLLIIGLGIIGTSFAQDVKREREISFVTTTQGDHQIVLKKQSKKKPNKFRRISFSNIDTYGINLNKENIGANLNFGIGYEKRFPIKESKFTFYRGPEFITSINALTENETLTLSQKFVYNLGLNYSFKKISIGIENKSYIQVSASPIFEDNGIATKVINPYLTISLKL